MSFRLFLSSRFAVLLFVLINICTDDVAAQVKQKTQLKNDMSSMDVSVGIFGQLTQARVPVTSQQYSGGIFTTQKSQNASPSAGVLTTFHQQFTRWLGYNVNVGYTRFTENYSSGSAFIPAATPYNPLISNFARGSIGTNIAETTVAMVTQGPRNRSFRTFAQLGGGGLFFLPYTHVDAYNYQIRPVMVFGVGMNYRLTERFSLKAEYRGLFYKSPDFAPTKYEVPVTRMFTVTNEPVVSLTCTFSGRKLVRMAHLGR